jgi:hypothetical protein
MLFGSVLGVLDPFYVFVMVGVMLVFLIIGRTYILVGGFFIVDEISFVLILLRL